MLKSFDLAWIVVSDIKKAKKFFAETLGLKEHTYAEELGWAEFEGSEGGTRIGLAQESEEQGTCAGENAIITLTVDNLETTVSELRKKGVKLIGGILEVPGHVKMQMFTDPDGNKFQAVQIL